MDGCRRFGIVSVYVAAKSLRGKPPKKALHLPDVRLVS
jgi:hypothetical protein